MGGYRLPGRWSRSAVLVLALILALPLIPAQAVPCDAYRLDTASLVRREIPVVVAVDETWRQAYGAGAEDAARHLISDVNHVLEPTGMSLVVADYLAWTTEESELSMSQMLGHLDSSVTAQPGQLVVGLTGRQVSRMDGIAHVGHLHLVARRHPNEPQLDGLVVAHEVGHLLGAHHHECDHDYLCVMAPEGSETPVRWCQHHLQEIQAGAALLSSRS